jgi:trigger factor
MQITVEKLSPVLVEFRVEVPAAQVTSEVEQAYVNLQRTARIRGFRPGKAPRNVLTHVYGGRVAAEVAQRLADTTLNRALVERQVQPLSQPDVVLSQLKADLPFSFKARFEVRPEIESVQWEGLEVKRTAVKVTDALLDADLQRLRREHATLQAPEPARAAQKGDLVSIGFVLSIEGSARDAEQEIETELGSGQIFSELEEGLEGMSVGESKDVAMTFPERHQNAELRGKAVSFHVTIKGIKERKLPELDDAFAKDLNHADLAALKADCTARLEKELKQRSSDAVAEQLVVELCKKNPVPVPPSLVQQQALLTERELTQSARRMGQRLELNEEIRLRVRADAEVKVRAGLLMAEIAKAKQVIITDEDIERGYVELAEQSGKNVAKVKAEYRDPKRREMLVGMILEDKILDMLESAAQVTEEPAEG